MIFTNKVMLDNNLSFLGSGNWYFFIRELIRIIFFLDENGLHDDQDMNTGVTKSEKR